MVVMRHQVVFIIGFNLLVLGSLVVLGQARYSDFRKYHEAIATETTANISTAINNFVVERKRQVQVFVKENAVSINQYAIDVDDESAREQISNKLREHFPDYFAFTIASNDGSPIVDDFDGYIGDICQDDIVMFSRGEKPDVRVHPNPHIYHFDMMSKYEADSGGVFFVSFPADLFGELIKPAQVSGHTVLLLFVDGETELIEATAKGSRIRTARDDYRIQPDEKLRVLGYKNIPGTQWKVVDLHNPALFTNYLNVLVVQLGGIMLMFIGASLAMFIYIRRAEALRLQAEHYKDEFISLMSHEFRTPLTSILGALKLLKGGVAGVLEKQTAEMVDIALSNSDRLLFLVNDILDIQRIESGKMVFEFSDECLNDIIQKSVDNIRNIAEREGMVIKVSAPENRIIISMDPNRMLQAVSNLIANAIKYGEDKDHIQVAYGFSSNKDMVYITVTDHGTGISPDDQQRIFDKFIMLNNIKRETSSSGLGLTIVRLIAREHCGDVSVSSKPGEGTSFTISLPAHPAITSAS